MAGRRKRKEDEVASLAAALAEEALVVWKVMSWTKNGAPPVFGAPTKCPECGAFGLVIKVDNREGRARNRCTECQREFVLTERAIDAVTVGKMPIPPGMMLPGHEARARRQAAEEEARLADEAKLPTFDDVELVDLTPRPPVPTYQPAEASELPPPDLPAERATSGLYRPAAATPDPYAPAPYAPAPQAPEVYPAEPHPAETSPVSHHHPPAEAYPPPDPYRSAPRPGAHPGPDPYPPADPYRSPPEGYAPDPYRSAPPHPHAYPAHPDAYPPDPTPHDPYQTAAALDPYPPRDPSPRSGPAAGHPTGYPQEPGADPYGGRYPSEPPPGYPPQRSGSYADRPPSYPAGSEAPGRPPESLRPAAGYPTLRPLPPSPRYPGFDPDAPAQENLPPPHPAAAAGYPPTTDDPPRAAPPPAAYRTPPPDADPRRAPAPPADPRVPAAGYPGPPATDSRVPAAGYPGPPATDSRVPAAGYPGPPGAPRPPAGNDAIGPARSPAFDEPTPTGAARVPTAPAAPSPEPAAPRPVGDGEAPPPARASRFPRRAPTDRPAPTDDPFVTGAEAAISAASAPVDAAPEPVRPDAVHPEAVDPTAGAPTTPAPTAARPGAAAHSGRHGTSRHHRRPTPSEGPGIGDLADPPTTDDPAAAPPGLTSPTGARATAASDAPPRGRDAADPGRPPTAGDDAGAPTFPLPAVVGPLEGSGAGDPTTPTSAAEVVARSKAAQSGTPVADRASTPPSPVDLGPKPSSLFSAPRPSSGPGNGRATPPPATPDPATPAEPTTPDASAPPAAKAPTTPATLDRPLRVLLVEDDPTDAAVVEALLGASGPEVVLITASSRERGQAMATDEQPDVVLLDLDLPDSHGLATITRWIFAGLPGRVIVMSGDYSPELVERGKEQGVAEFVHKRHLMQLLQLGDEGTAEFVRLLTEIATSDLVG